MPSLIPLPYLHIITPCLLLVPLLTLAPPKTPPKSEPDGIVPITIQKVIPRRGWIILLLSLIAITSLLDGAMTVAILLGAESRHHLSEVEGINLVGWLAYPIGGFLIWSLTGIVCQWRRRWNDGGLKLLTILAWGMEIPNLVYLIIRVTRASGSWSIFTILSVPPSGLRILLLPILLVVISKPIITYEAASESSPLLGQQEGNAEAGSSTGSGSGQRTYGSIKNKSSNGGLSSAVPTGANTPATQNKTSIIIPKTLGEVKRDERVLTWAEVWDRFKKLSPKLWPSTSRKLQFYVVLVIGLLAVGRVLTPLGPIALGRLIRALTQAENHQIGVSVWPPFIAYFVIRFVRGSFIYFLQQLLWVPVSQYTDKEMQLLCFNHLLNLSLAYHTRRNTGEVLKVIDRGSAINSLFSSVLFTAAPAIIDIIIGFAIFYYLYGGLLASITSVIMVLYIYISVTATQRRVATRRQLMDRDIKQRGIISDVLTNWESVKYFTAEQREVDRFSEAISAYQEAEKKWNIDWQTLYLLQTSMLSFGLLVGSLLISVRIMQGVWDAAELVVFIQYFQALSSPLNQLGSLYAQLNRNSIDAEKMFALLAETTEVRDEEGAKDLVVTDGVVEFDNVRFSYDGKVEALKGVSFKIDKGTSMALVGESGSGKSTILRLLYRFYDIDSGAIRIDGQDISKVTQSSLRKAIGIVPQDSVLWNDTIGANVSYGKEGATDEEIIEASMAAKLHERILGFKDEYATIVGERGIRLSGGEKQRVSLARMFLKSPAILVLDEATSALDTETEREIQKALADLAKGRTSLSIAHRLSTIINSDQIIVMKDGSLIEQGSYRDLVQAEGTFASMWKNQIFTDAERVAQAENAGPGGENNLINLEGEDASRKEGNKEGGDTILQAKDAATPAGANATPEGAQGYDTGHEDTTEEPHSSYAEAVKAEPTSPHLPPADGSSGSDAKRVSFPSAQLDTQPSAEAQASTPDRPSIDAQGRVDEPASKHLAASEMSKTQSDQSGQSQSSQGVQGPQDPAVQALGKDKDKRKRLSSIKGFVRRISDRDPGLNRNPSGRSTSGGSK